jgi:hypothetical protein
LIFGSHTPAKDERPQRPAGVSDRRRIVTPVLIPAVGRLLFFPQPVLWFCKFRS